ncbi:hypothetical protein Pcac1_g19829 [Phytophthora cactorum]|uniref:Uncharacterized protein n=1 Tax=Phytophthora cactorum TaxID=29920 RepID=A0A8T1BRC8_9STRA|nr:hypothetical protein Pcac1_g19829 [Phytophthora cactorum]KAG2908964.1 hypothetical protein PC115_g13439 [Phytophthora cactorum]KAG2913716.1 hypothetical protein PC114_g8488 [Phytophthora cactorum]KAG2942836.1 hypothetical protein PC117_g9628 [Phytophthora cactorum]KAG3022433.1 hypothetical protein PC119_g9269 [Phytophthora cactorum]
MSSLTTTPAQEFASADSATSVPASAGTTTSVPAQASTSTTESTLSVDEYHALPYKKRVEDKAAAPETILEGSSVLNTDGSMSTDYGSDISDVPMEDGEVPSSAADSESAAVAHDPVTGSRRPREDDPSASSSKRSRNDEEEKAPTPVTLSSPRSVPTERAPWMPRASEIASRLGATSPPNQIQLYVCSAIIDDAEAAAQHFDPMTNQRRDYYIGFIHELRWHASRKTSRKSKVPEWMALCQSWNAFVEHFNKDAKAYRARITAAQQRFETFSRRHMIDRLHNEAMEADIPCAVPFGTVCSHSPPGAERLSERDVTGYTTVRVPVQLRDLRVQLERRDERRETPSVSGDRSARAGVTPGLRSGLRTPSPFLERPLSERSEVLMYLGGEEILSNEYEDEPDLGASSGVHSPRFARLSTESSRAHRAVVAAGAERYPSYGQPQVDRDSRALYDRVAALEQFQSVEFAQLQHELRYQKEQAAQTASNIQVELETQVVRIHDRVAALEKLDYAASSSSASRQG